MKLSPLEARRQRNAFRRKVGAIISANDKIYKTATAEAFKYIRDLRDEVRGAIVNAEGFELVHLRRIRDELDAAGARLANRFNASMAVHQDKTWDLGKDMVDQGFIAAKIDVSLPMLSDNQLIAVKDYTADLITKMSAQTIEDISGHLRRGIIAGDNPYKTMKRIEDVLLKKDKGAFWRAERIVRTEQGRVFNIANDERMEQAREVLPDLRKQWLTAGDENVRPDHVKAGSDYSPGGRIGPIPVDEDYIVGGFPLAYPGDPAGVPSQTINCRCTSVPWRDAWGKG